jgi:hypothetical protein
MFEDGVRALNADERFVVKDVAEIVAERIEHSGTDHSDHPPTNQ